MNDFNSLVKEIDFLLETKESVVIAIDGMSASFKTALANYLKKKYDGNVIHMDDFYRRRSENFPESIMNSDDGNINYDYLRFKVINKIRKESLSYSKFDCSKQEFLKEEIIDRKKLTIIEGTYSLNPKLGKYYDLSVFLFSNEKEQAQRIKNRNQNNYKWFIDVWVALEKRYFEKYSIKNKADLVIDASTLTFETF